MEKILNYRKKSYIRELLTEVSVPSMYHFTNNAHGATHCTAMKIPSNTSKFYVDFKNNFLKDGKNCYVPSFFGPLVPDQANCVLRHSQFQSFYV